MRLIVGIDDSGHQFAFDVTTWEKLKQYIINCLNVEHDKTLFAAVVACQTEDDLMNNDEIIEMLWDHGDIFQGRDMFTELRDSVDPQLPPDPLKKDEVPLGILQAASYISLQSSLLASKVSRILDAIIWEKDGKKAAQLLRELDQSLIHEREIAYSEGKVACVPKEAIKSFDEVLQSMENQIGTARKAIQNIKLKEKK